jgi:uncharacterized protein involved in exopolysaccharide biosynthesis
MSPTKRSETQTEFEQEVDFGRYLKALARGWWLLAGGLVIGAVIGAALSLGSGNLYKGKASIYLGQPLAVNSSAGIQSLSTNPSTVGQLAHATDVLSQVANSSGLPLSKLKAGVSTASVSGSLSKLGQSPLVAISVQAKAPRKAVTDATNALAKTILTRLSSYPRQKIAILQAQIASDKSQIAAIDKHVNAIGAASSSSTEQLLLLTRRGTLSDEVQTDQLLLVQAKTVEQGSIVSFAKATKTTGRSRKSSPLVGGALGLLVGALCSLTLPASRRRSQS